MFLFFDAIQDGFPSTHSDLSFYSASAVRWRMNICSVEANSGTPDLDKIHVTCAPVVSVDCELFKVFGSHVTMTTFDRLLLDDVSKGKGAQNAERSEWIERTSTTLSSRERKRKRRTGGVGDTLVSLDRRFTSVLTRTSFDVEGHANYLSLCACQNTKTKNRERVHEEERSFFCAFAGCQLLESQSQKSIPRC